VARLYILWHRINSSLWFLPVIIVGLAIGLALGLIRVERLLGTALSDPASALFGVGIDGSRGLLEAIASSVITVAGVTFSVMVVALSQAASQYTPRVLRNFTASRVTQGVLGFFVAIYAYCLLVLRVMDAHFVPRAAVLGAIVLAMAGTGVLIFFIHHVAESIQASKILSEVARDTRRAMERLFPEPLGEGLDETSDTPPEVARTLAEARFSTVTADKTGYIEAVDADGLVCFASKHEIIARMERGIGEFVAEGTALLSISQGTTPMEDKRAELNQLVAIGRLRTIEQDAAFGLSQLVDIAVKALSPAVNAPAIAMMCLDHLGGLLHYLAGRRIPSPYRFEGGQLCVVAQVLDFEAYLDTAYASILLYAAQNPAIYMAMLSSLRMAGSGARGASRRRACARWARKAAHAAERALTTDEARERVCALAARLETELLSKGGYAAEAPDSHMPH